jgi:LmbE family N-acetylglucosaminyl deacetylase
MLRADESLAERRVDETRRAASILGIHRVEFLDYIDSGMMGYPANEDPLSFWNADLEEAAEQVARILSAERAEVLTVYDDHGGYGHPDHIKVSQVGLRAAELARTPRVFQATTNRDHLLRLIAGARSADLDLPELPDPADFEGFGVAESDITTAVDVTPFVGAKRAAMAAHATQISDTSLFLALPEDAFALTWGTEWFVRVGAPPRANERWLLDAEPASSVRERA